ncbi:uncharacterized protein LOC141730693 [Zonotrichia albicollis]|uniref:uncharacterized protein LOC141730693 n=1 Tax=Zonotrichia albicollis TaxID=44394 RepID=UPI003D80D18F
MEFCRRLLVDLDGIGKGVAALIITARCLVPELQVSSPVLLCDECHLKKRKEDSAVLYSSPKPCGIVQPQSTAEIPVVVAVQALATHRTDVLIGVFGDERNPLRAQLRSSGRLAEISPSPRLAELGRIPAPQPVDELHLPKFKPQPPKERRISLDCLATRWRHFRTGKEEAARALKEVQDFSQSSGAEAFSILPLPGVLQPGESQQVSSTLSGHLNTTCNILELCHMEGGSTSDVLMPRVASRVSSSQSPQEINCGSQAPLRDRRELKEPAQKVKEEAKAIEEEERRKEEERQKKGKKSVSVGKQPPIPAKGKTKTRENKETKIPKKGNQNPREEGNQNPREGGNQNPREEGKQSIRREENDSIREEGHQSIREEGNQNPREE